MKKLLFFFFLSFVSITMAQENGYRKTYIQEGKLIKFSEYVNFTLTIQDIFNTIPDIP